MNEQDKKTHKKLVELKKALEKIQHEIQRLMKKVSTRRDN